MADLEAERQKVSLLQQPVQEGNTSLNEQSLKVTSLRQESGEPNTLVERQALEIREKTTQLGEKKTTKIDRLVLDNANLDRELAEKKISHDGLSERVSLLNGELDKTQTLVQNRENHRPRAYHSSTPPFPAMSRVQGRDVQQGC